MALGDTSTVLHLLRYTLPLHRPRSSILIIWELYAANSVAIYRTV